MTYRREGKRAWPVWLLVCLFLVTQFAAVASANQTHHSEDHCCLLCHVGPLPFLNTNVAAVAVPVFTTVWMESAPDFTPVDEVLLSTSSSRAPPA